MKISVLLGCIFIAGCTHLPRGQFEIQSDWSELIHPLHATTAARYAGDGINCGVHHLTQTRHQNELPANARRCIREAMRQKLSHKYAYTWITADVLVQTSLVYNADANQYWHAEFYTIPDGSDWGWKIQQCEKLDIKLPRLFLDFKNCQAVKPEDWLGVDPS
jgi:hypothetical protein